MSAQFVSAILTLVACFVLLCRVDKMTRGITKPVVFFQHALLAMGMFGSVLIRFTAYAEWADASMAAGLLAFLLSSLDRWRVSAPEGTTKPMPLDGADHPETSI